MSTDSGTTKSGTDQAVEWSPGLDRVTGMAAHPSMQNKSTKDIGILLAEARRHLVDTANMPDVPARDEYIEQLKELIAAYELALDWRK